MAPKQLHAARQVLNTFPQPKIFWTWKWVYWIRGYPQFYPTLMMNRAIRMTNQHVKPGASEPHIAAAKGKSNNVLNISIHLTEYGSVWSSCEAYQGMNKPRGWDADGLMWKTWCRTDPLTNQSMIPWKAISQCWQACQHYILTPASQGQTWPNQYAIIYWHVLIK